jgi:hypothetical protein
VNRDSGLWLRIRDDLERVPSPEPRLDRVVRRARVRTIQRYAVGAVVALATIAALVPLARLSPLALGDREQRPATPGTSRIDPRLTGIWWVTSGTNFPLAGRAPLLYRLSADGTFSGDPYGQLDTYPRWSGTYEVEGTTIVFTPDRGESCTAIATINAPDRLHLSFSEDEGLACSAGTGTSWTFRRVSPGSPESHGIRSYQDAEAGVPPSMGRFDDLRGIWLLEGGDHLLRIGFNHDYAIAGGGRLGTDPDDLGTIETDGAGSLIFTSGAESGTCAEGTVTVWQGVLVNEDALAATFPADACGGLPEGGGSWVRISWP